MWVMPQIAIQALIQQGLREIKDNPDILNDIFEYMEDPMLESSYGTSYVTKIKEWFLETKIPVLHAWTFNADRIPCISIHLANEAEDEQKAALSDHFETREDGQDIGTSVITSQIDIGIHASKTADQVLWLYYIVTYILFRNKRFFQGLGMHLQTFTASDWDKRQEYMVENIWTRWMRFRCVTENFWITRDVPITPTEVEVIPIPEPAGLVDPELEQQQEEEDIGFISLE